MRKAGGEEHIHTCLGQYILHACFKDQPREQDVEEVKYMILDDCWTENLDPSLFMISFSLDLKNMIV